MNEDLDRLRSGCERALTLHGIRSADSFLSEMAAGPADVYGEGGAVEELETEVGELLQKPAVVFMPSGTMAQQIALRVHADRRNLRTFGCHPTSHLELHEDNAYQRLHDLFAVPVGNSRTLLSRADLAEVHEPLSSVLFELPQREIGGQLPAWSDLEEQIAYARGRDAAVHVDGARLWECTPYYAKELHEIAALFDTVYVSFYKGLGALSGCCLAGEEDVIQEARLWRHRHGGTLWSLWPLAASALGAMRKRLPLMPTYYEHAVAIAAALHDVPGVEIVPDPPQTPAMHLHLRTTKDRLEEAVRVVAEKESIWTWSWSFEADTPSIRVVELAVGDATLDFTPAEVAGIVARFVTT
ncbi:MAG TPA: beta-eliminating lyase-related protein [Actinomycetota bacterium]